MSALAALCGVLVAGGLWLAASSWRPVARTSRTALSRDISLRLAESRSRAALASGNKILITHLVELKNGGSLNLFDTISDNRGSIHATGGGTLGLGGDWKNSGTIAATDVTLNLGGTFTPADLGTIQRNGGTVNLSGVLDALRQQIGPIA